MVLIFGGVALVLVLFMFQMFRLQERDRRSATEISDLKTLNQTLEELHRSEESLAHGQRLENIENFEEDEGYSFGMSM